MAPSLWTRFVQIVAGFQVVAGLAGVALGPAGRPSPVPTAILAAQAFAFAAAAALLLRGGRRDPRAVSLGTAFLIVAGAFSSRPGEWLVEAVGPGLRWAPTLLTTLQVQAFLAFYVWLFVRDFPRATIHGGGQRLVDAMIRVSLVTGLLLFGLGALPVVPAGVAPILDNQWAILFALVLGAGLVLVRKARTVSLPEARRARLFVAGLALGFGPVALEIVLEALVPEYRLWARQPDVRRVMIVVIEAFLLTTPFTTAYAVLVQQVLDVRLVVRRAIQYALARATVLAVAAFPLLGLLAYLYRHRYERLADLLTGTRPLLLLGALAVAVAALRERRRFLDAVDRRFFRDQYDSHRILAQLVERSRGAANAGELATLITREVDRALHLESIALLLMEPATGRLVSPDGKVRPLSAASPLVTLLAGSAEPLEVDLEGPRAALRRLPGEEREWLADGGFELLVPLIASDGTLIGMLALGGKKSELPFSREDRLLLGAIVASSALTLENRLIRSTPSPGSQDTPSGPTATPSLAPEEELAGECAHCRTLYPARVGLCSFCHVPVSKGQVPYVLLGKFRFERRVGSGGMGVVYRATDLALGRAVAIKTLPKISPEHAMRLRREARAVASLSHPNLALIFGAETWHGTPLLVFEYLDGGTLADRLRVGRLSLEDGLDLGVIMADVLDRAHGAGVLHRDIKPSNIGYSAEGVPKLLDFGLARILHDSRGEGSSSGGEPSSDGNTASMVIRPPEASTTDNAVLGTLAYLSPEALQGKPPEPYYDLWSLAITLAEAITGRNPALGMTAGETMERIGLGRIPDVRELLPDCPEDVALFFQDALHADRWRRPSSARHMKARLLWLRTQLAL
jgi:hypothetical protein